MEKIQQIVYRGPIQPLSSSTWYLLLLTSCIGSMDISSFFTSDPLMSISHYYLLSIAYNTFYFCVLRFFSVWQMHDIINSANTMSCRGVWMPYGSPMLHLSIPQNLTWNPWQLLNVLLFLKICTFQNVALMESYSV